MKKKMRVASISSLALACLLISGTAAHAADGSAKYKGCTNYVKVWRDGSKVKAFGKMTCKRRTLIMRPAVVLSADGGKHGMIIKGKACRAATTCQTVTVSLSAKHGQTYRASNAGTIDTDDVGSKSSVAHATYKA